MVKGNELQPWTWRPLAASIYLQLNVKKTASAMLKGIQNDRLPYDITGIQCYSIESLFINWNIGAYISLSGSILVSKAKWNITSIRQISKYKPSYHIIIQVLHIKVAMQALDQQIRRFDFKFYCKCRIIPKFEVLIPDQADIWAIANPMGLMKILCLRC